MQLQSHEFSATSSWPYILIFPQQMSQILRERCSPEEAPHKTAEAVGTALTEGWCPASCVSFETA